MDKIDTSAEAVERLAQAFSDCGSAQDDYVAALLRALAAERDEMNDLFERIRAADQRGIDRWRAEKPGRDLIRPDMADATVWLLDQLERAEAERDAAVAEAARMREALLAAAAQFDMYERSHRAKVGDPQAALKAETNRRMAEQMRAALAQEGGA